MKRWLAALFLVVISFAVPAEGFRSAALAEDSFRLVITMADGSRFDAPKLPEQVGFAQPMVSADGKYVGWLALFPNCCTSYPIPLRLVVLGRSQQLHTFDGIGLAIFSWRFSPDAASVAYSQSVLHGSDFQHFELRRIADGKLLSQYEFPHNEADNTRAQKRAPSWVRRVR